MLVKAYFNLHKKCWSVIACEGEHKGRVIAHCDEMQLTDVNFRVSESGRRRVLREKRKNVHAFVIGHLHGWENATLRFNVDAEVSALGWWPASAERASYNPYKGAHFYVKSSGQKVVHALSVLMTKQREVLLRGALTQEMIDWVTIAEKERIQDPTLNFEYAFGLTMHWAGILYERAANIGAQGEKKWER